ncbi:MAG: NUDIX hydrolase [Apibacter sp.]|nr:NUDIX hydrolase [Apibacter sp.]
MEKIKNLNVRVYGLLVKDNSLMFLNEMYAGKQLLKLPGGGLELGEGTLDTLKREFKEELNLEVTIQEHFYTQDFFLKSKLTPDSQLLTVYYKVDCNNFSNLQIIEKSIHEVVWIPLDKINIDTITLPVDKIVLKKLLKKNT